MIELLIHYILRSLRQTVVKNFLPNIVLVTEALGVEFYFPSPHHRGHGERIKNMGCFDEYSSETPRHQSVERRIFNR